jgi:enterochelin esterase family protein
MHRFTIALIFASFALAQDDDRGYLPPPTVHADRTVTLRLAAPKASDVKFAIRSAGFKPQPMKKDGAGVWEITTAPLEPETYEYNFIVDGVLTADPNNHNFISTVGRGSRYFEIPSDPPRFDSVRNVPHGAIQIRIYESAMRKTVQQLYIYVPPSYESSPQKRYPALYLRHGNGTDESNWSALGAARAGVILDNLIADGKAREMILVMGQGYPLEGPAVTLASYAQVGEELLREVIPFVEKTYRISPGRENRAIAGLSMGARQSFMIGLSHLDQFAYIGEFSAGGNIADYKVWPSGFLSDPAATNKNLKLLFLACGTDDPRFEPHNQASSFLKQNNIRHVYFTTPGEHEPKVWRHAFYEFAQKLFQP